MVRAPAFLPAALVMARMTGPAGFAFELANGGGWTYAALGASAIVTEELSPIFAGIAAHEGELHLWRAIAALTIGGWVATTLLYLIGRSKWDYIRRRWPRTRAAGTVALRRVARKPVATSFLVRFIFGLRLVLPLVSGAARVPAAIYLPVSFAGSALWSIVYTFIGYVAGEAAVNVMGKLDRAAEIPGAVLVTALVLALLRWNRRRNDRKLERRRRPRPNALERRQGDAAISTERT